MQKYISMLKCLNENGLAEMEEKKIGGRLAGGRRREK